MHWLINPIKNHYADFSGRATRKEYWMFMLVYILFAFVAAFLFSFLGPVLGETLLLVGAVAVIVVFLGTLIPAIALQVRRLHDTGRSGWWYFIGFIPYIGGIALLVMTALPSQAGTNAYGLNVYEVLASIQPTPSPIIPPTGE
jgi:uncharacterized membrane protein YhaH (DUF805 family)